MDRKTRKLLKMYRSMHPQGDVDRTYLKRKKGGRGLISVEECVMLEKTSLGFYINGKEEMLLQEVVKEDIMSETENPKTVIEQLKQLDNVYRALIESHLRYANVIWGSIPSSKIKILQNLQDRARTIIERARIKDAWSYNWLNVEQLIKFDRSTMTYKIMNRMCPESLWDKFPQISLHSNYNTRNCKDIQIPRYNLEYVKKGFHYSALTAWNSIPISIRELPTFPQFKRNLKTHLKS